MWQEGIEQKSIYQQQVLVHEPGYGLRAHLARCCKCIRWREQGQSIAQCCCVLLKGSPGLLIFFWAKCSGQLKSIFIQFVVSFADFIPAAIVWCWMSCGSGSDAEGSCSPLH